MRFTPDLEELLPVFPREGAELYASLGPTLPGTRTGISPPRRTRPSIRASRLLDKDRTTTLWSSGLQQARKQLWEAITPTCAYFLHQLTVYAQVGSALLRAELDRAPVESLRALTDAGASVASLPRELLQPLPRYPSWPWEHDGNTLPAEHDRVRRALGYAIKDAQHAEIPDPAELWRAGGYNSLADCVTPLLDYAEACVTHVGQRPYLRGPLSERPTMTDG